MGLERILSGVIGRVRRRQPQSVSLEEQSVSLEEYSEKLRKLENYLPGKEPILYDFARFLADNSRPGPIVPGGFVNLVVFTLAALESGHDRRGSPTGRSMDGYPKEAFSNLLPYISDIAKAVFPKGFAREVDAIYQNVIGQKTIGRVGPPSGPNYERAKLIEFGGRPMLVIPFEIYPQTAQEVAKIANELADFVSGKEGKPYNVRRNMWNDPRSNSEPLFFVAESEYSSSGWRVESDPYHTFYGWDPQNSGEVYIRPDFLNKEKRPLLEEFLKTLKKDRP